MGNYTELIISCQLKPETPKYIIEKIKLMTEGTSPDELGFDFSRNVLISASSYVGLTVCYCNFQENDYGEYELSCKSSLKNYENEIEKLCAWLEPWVASGMGPDDCYAIAWCEEAEMPKFFKALND